MKIIAFVFTLYYYINLIYLFKNSLLVIFIRHLQSVSNGSVLRVERRAATSSVSAENFEASSASFAENIQSSYEQTNS